ncbi:MAG: Hsp70 family protein [Blastochloris viridis]|uniref:Hsp70 family protein n=1 Tax=Blastochloris viridis TaxID=1079 RepID=A0A6N4QYX4_BLAVI|nr:MAG: Hsp70 family protein [Blastochloris viridis]
MQPVIAAIDFGTSNSTVGIMQGGQPVLLQPETGKRAVPTALFFPHGKTTPIPGFAAIQAYLGEDPGRFMRGLKGVLGTDLFNESTQIGTQPVTFREIIASYIGWLVKTAEAELGHPVTHLMLGRPVHFLTNQPEADAIAESQLREVVATLGIPHVAFMAEPLAAAYHYEHTLKQEELALIIDIGGGTADFSLLRLGPKLKDKADRTTDILATHGLRLGGAMIDQAFAMAHVMPTFGRGTEIAGPTGPKGLTVPEGYFTQLTTWHRIHRMYERKTLQEVGGVLQEALEPRKVERLVTLLEERGGHKLMLDIEGAKITLSDAAEALLNLGWIERDLTLPLTAEALASATQNWRNTLTDSIRHTLAQANTTAEHLTTVFVTGGPSAMPLVQATIRNALPQSNIILGDQLTSVGTGLVLAAHRHFA